MADNMQLLIDAGRQIGKQYSIGLPEHPDYDALYKALKERLASRLIEFLDYDMEGLINLVYRLDIREKDFDAAMRGPSTRIIAEQLAELIIRRELEKAYTRKLYREKK